MSDISPGPSPISLSPTPPSTPSSYGFSYPQGGSALTSPGHTHSQTPSSPSLSSPPPLTGTLPKSRPTPKPPRQRPNLPPPRPPSGTSGLSPQPLDHATGLLDGLSPESMSTGKANRQTRKHWVRIFPVKRIRISSGSRVRFIRQFWRACVIYKLCYGETKALNLNGCWLLSASALWMLLFCSGLRAGGRWALIQTGKKQCVYLISPDVTSPSGCVCCTYVTSFLLFFRVLLAVFSVLLTLLSAWLWRVKPHPNTSTMPWTSNTHHLRNTRFTHK